MPDLSHYKPGDPLVLRATYDGPMVNDAAIFARVSGVFVCVSRADIISPTPALDAPETGDERKAVGFGDVQVSAVPTYEDLVAALGGLAVAVEAEIDVHARSLAFRRRFDQAKIYSAIANRRA